MGGAHSTVGLGLPTSTKLRSLEEKPLYYTLRQKNGNYILNFFLFFLLHSTPYGRIDSLWHGLIHFARDDQALDVQTR